MTRDVPIYAYAARQIAPIMLDARIGVTPHELPIIFIDNDFFSELSSRDAEIPKTQCEEFLQTMNEMQTSLDEDEQDADPDPEEPFREADAKVESGEFLTVPGE